MRLLRFFFLSPLLVMLSCTSPEKNERRFPSSVFPAGTKIIFDTDSAFFNDDGAALAMLVKSGRFDILGLTVTAGNHWIPQGSAYMLHLLEVLKRADIPVFTGETSNIRFEREAINKLKSTRLLPSQKRKSFLAWTGALSQPEDHELSPPFGGSFAALTPSPVHAVGFLIETVRKNPGEVVIVALGPMTNIAEALKKAPDIALKIKSLIFMGGAARAEGNTTPYAEFNFWFDPVSANRVLQSPIPNKVMFGLDITNQAVLTKAEFDRVVRVETPITAIYNEDLGNRWPGFNKNPEKTSYVWDALVAVYMLDATCVLASQELFLKVTEAYGPRMGQVEVSDRPRAGYSPVQVMTKLDRRKFFTLYTEMLTAKP